VTRTTSTNWPGRGAGDARHEQRAVAEVRRSVGASSGINPKPPILWIRGADDVIVSDTSLFDFGYLGKLGLGARVAR
jgi:hypothetical protein